VVTPRKFLPDETQGEFLPVESSSEEFSTETEEGSGEFLIEDTTEYEIGSGEMQPLPDGAITSFLFKEGQATIGSDSAF